MKKYFILLLTSFVVLPSLIFAKDKSEEETVRIGMDYHKNNVKINLLALGLTNFSFQYERALSRKFSVGLGLRLQPATGIPFKTLIKNQAGIAKTDTVTINFLERSKMSNWAITPEVRYYFGKKPLNGFYVAPFVRVSGYSLSWAYLFLDQNNTQHTLDFRGDATSFTLGLLLGCQWHVGEHFLIDWWMMGPSYGSVNFSANANSDLSLITNDDKTKLQTNLNKAFNDVGSSYHISTKTVVDNSGVKINGDAPFGGIRTGLCVGISF